MIHIRYDNIALSPLLLAVIVSKLTTDRLEFNSSEHESAVENSESDNDEDDIASEFVKPSEEDTLEYVKQHQFKLDMCGCKNYMGSHAVK